MYICIFQQLSAKYISMSEQTTSEPILVYITASSEEEAAGLARILVEAKLAACVNMLSNVRSIYSWQGNIEDDRELLMIVKTQRHLFDRLAAKVREIHSYDVPEIIALSIINGSPDYLRWLQESTDQNHHEGGNQ
jgi:periplasmic divalent cation tolerance protein